VTEARVSQNSTGEIRTRKVGTYQVRVREIRTRKVGTYQVRVREIRTRKVGTPKVSAEIRLRRRILFPVPCLRRLSSS